MKKYLLMVIGCAVLVLPKLTLADAPPPPPFTLDVTYEGQKIADEKFSAAILTCQSGSQDSSEHAAADKLNITQDDPANNCTWKLYSTPISDSCSASQCHFRWVMGNFKAAVYLPSFDKVFISNSINRKYQGHYGFDTPRNYGLSLTKDGQASIAEATGTGNDNQNVDPAAQNITTDPSIPGPSKGSPEEMAPLVLLLSIFSSILITLPLELIITLIFALVKKLPKLILLGTAIGNIISVPLLWIIVSVWYWTLFPAEIAVVFFEASLIKLFGRKKISWKWCLIISLVMNVASFIFGPWLWNSLNNG